MASQAWRGPCACLLLCCSNAFMTTAWCVLQARARRRRARCRGLSACAHLPSAFHASHAFAFVLLREQVPTPEIPRLEHDKGYRLELAHSIL